MHPTLRSQLEAVYGSADRAPPELTVLFEAVSASYEQADQDRRAHELVAKELAERTRLLVANDARKQAVLDGLPGALLVFTPEATLVACYGAELAGLVPTDAANGTLVEALFPGAAEVWTRALSSAFESPGLHAFEFRRTAEGNEVVYEVRIGASGDRAAAFARNVTEVRRARTRLLVSDRLASVSTLASGVAHEINNPLTYMLMNIDLVRSEFERLPPDVVAGMDPELGEAIAEARAGGERVAEIVQQLRSFSRTDDERITQVDVVNMLDTTLKLAGSDLRHRARIVRDYGVVSRVATDESRLRQAVLNLLVNAAQALPPGQASTHIIVVGTRPADNGDVLIEVSDTGPGIPHELHGSLFDPFFTTKPVGVGTGLGLAICHSIVTKLGGELGFRTELGKGTTFWIKLPSSASVSAAPEPAAPVAAPSRGRVLVVDDEENVGRALVRLLKGCDVTCVTSGAEAEDVLGRESFGVVLCDLMMPEMTGMELFTRVRNSDPALAQRFVFMTGGTFSAPIRRFVAEVANPVVDKPFDVKVLHRVVNERLDEHAPAE